MEVREYDAQDSLEVKNFILSILEKEYPFDRSAYKDTDINDVSGTYSGKGNAFFVIEKGNKIVGTVGVKKETGENVLIRRLFVDENHRKKGLGTMLLVRAIEFCRSKGYKQAIFRATDRMLGAMNLCKKMGFKEKEDLEVSGFHIHKFVLKL
ncbi:MAG: GNAT family N-acetyltransferase [Candidatus Omnitrophica bacterium]|nr:GNAT family N-acetyltransferase [Candidatus Omnitrophota bacterium]